MRSGIKWGGGGAGRIRDQEGGMWDHSPGIRDQRPWDRDHHFFRDQGHGDQAVPYL